MCKYGNVFIWGQTVIYTYQIPWVITKQIQFLLSHRHTMSTCLLYTPSQDVHLSAVYPLTRCPLCCIPPHKMSTLLYTPSQDVHFAVYPLTSCPLVCCIPPHKMSHCMHVTAQLLQIVYRYAVSHSEVFQLSPCHSISTFTSCTTVCKSYHIVTSCTNVCMSHHTIKMSNCLYVTPHSHDVQLYVIPCSHKLYNCLYVIPHSHKL